MPNWCNNQLTVTGVGHRLENFAQLEEFIEKSKAEQQPLTFSGLVPEPGDPDDGNYDWYSWRVANWGTKWEPDCGSDPERGENSVSYLFHTAWSPPENWAQKVSEIFPALEFVLEYDEPGMMFAGVTIYRRGVLIEEREIDIREIYPDWDWDGEEEE